MRELNWDQYKNFSKDEFACRCGCGAADMDPAFLQNLQMLRTQVGFSLSISSGFRCPDYNAKVSKTGYTGPHTTGKAADILVNRGQAYLLMKEAFALEFDRVGVNQRGNSRFIHLDILKTGNTVWSY